MKKGLVALVVAGAMATANVQAFEDDKSGGVAASNSALGGVSDTTVTAGVVAAVILGAVIANNNGSSPERPVIEPPPPPPEPTCDGDDPLVDGVCIGTSVTVTVSGTTTIDVPVTFTYLPTV